MSTRLQVVTALSLAAVTLTGALASLGALPAKPALAQITINEPWMRATVPQQKATGAYMQLVAKKDLRLVEIRSPVAGLVEIHEMTMEKDVMKMRAISSLELPAGKTVELKPGSYHLMLFDLKQQIQEGEVVPVTLMVEDKDQKRQSIALQVPVRSLNGMASPGRAAP